MTYLCSICRLSLSSLTAYELVAKSGIKKASGPANGSVKNSKNGSKDRGSFVIQGCALAAAEVAVFYRAFSSDRIEHAYSILT